MDSLLTKKLKYSILSFKPFHSSSMRTIRYATEVTTQYGGVVDAIRFEDWSIPTGNSMYGCERGDNYCLWLPTHQKYHDCATCALYRRKEEVAYDIMVTCYEVKISLSDFKSDHGHNFVGNRNYYVIPDFLYKDIVSLVPEDVGIIVGYTNNSIHSTSLNMRVKKECQIKDITDKDRSLLLYNALKKWVAGKCGNEFADIMAMMSSES